LHLETGFDPGSGSQRTVLHCVRAALDFGSRRRSAHSGESGRGVRDLAVDGCNFLRSDVAIFRSLILMVGWTDVVIVSLIAIGSVVLIGVLGYLIDKTGTQEENQEGNKDK